MTTPSTGHAMILTELAKSALRKHTIIAISGVPTTYGRHSVSNVYREMCSFPRSAGITLSVVTRVASDVRRSCRPHTLVTAIPRFDRMPGSALRVTLSHQSDKVLNTPPRRNALFRRYCFPKSIF
ncbi:hypothetical protein B0H17DRAFT_554910 [Mycena rosella]|uniref:Uncharacterized protein n=1 Tax=Mycena rosella TaxID=1033263 RepID=A0AAD7DHU3_MYCRO|nr:hypothetical protein B0H17DRAFT_554910 [Mycena rosella]